MKLGFLTACLPELPLADIAAWASGRGYEALEVAVWPSTGSRDFEASHIDVANFGRAEADEITGLFDLLAALGLVLPGVLRKRPELTVYAAYGTILLMIAASVFHVSRGEASLIGINIFFLALAVFIAWGRRK